MSSLVVQRVAQHIPDQIARMVLVTPVPPSSEPAAPPRGERSTTCAPSRSSDADRFAAPQRPLGPSAVGDVDSV